MDDKPLIQTQLPIISHDGDYTYSRIKYAKCLTCSGICTSRITPFGEIQLYCENPYCLKKNEKYDGVYDVHRLQYCEIYLEECEIPALPLEYKYN